MSTPSPPTDNNSSNPPTIPPPQDTPVTNPSTSWNSPGNSYTHSPEHPPMKLPHLTFLYRLTCHIAPQDIEVGSPHGTGWVRSIANIAGGQVSGPRIEGVVMAGGADWAGVIEGTHSMTLDARYTILTNDTPPHPIYIRAHGLYRPGPETPYSTSDLSLPPPDTVTQDDVEFFSHLRLEAGMGPYNWVNGLVCIGVMCCVKERVIIDAYYLTNFPGREPEDVVVRRE